MNKLFAFISLSFLLTAPLCAQTFPDRDRATVVDTAHVLSPETIATLSQVLTAWEKTTHHQLIVATIPSLNGSDIADYGYKLGRHWRLGRTGFDDAAILILAPTERKVRIEVGTGLEPVLTDATTNQIIKTIIVPKLKAKDINGALTDGARAIITAADADPNGLVIHSPTTTPHKGGGIFLILMGGILALLTSIVLIIRKKKRPSDDLPDSDGSLSTKQTSSTSDKYQSSASNTPNRSAMGGYTPARGSLSNPPKSGSAVVSSARKSRSSQDSDYTAPIIYPTGSYSSPDPDPSPSSDSGFNSNNTDSNNFSGGGSSSDY